ncbi:fatty acid desaturase family protein [Pseudomonas entomophila]|uniref:fatty acid desaturase family protein n=1 Tax=Pseudomonas entomophila TaxID=312306 RepID=UPI002159AD46|nr:fatty acid desaturase [Pseudomonas entomophila]
MSLYLVPLGLFVFLAGGGSTGRMLLCSPLLAVAGYGLFLLAILGHEGFHFNLSRNALRSCYLGVWVSSSLPGFCVTGYFVDHWQHHRHSNSDQDPDYRLFSRYRTLVSRITLSRLVATLRYLLATGKLAFGPLATPSPLPMQALEVRRLARCNLIGQVSWLSVYGLATFQFDGLLTGVAVALTVAFLVSAMNAYQEHAFSSDHDAPPARSRTSRLSTWLHAGANYHLEHHLYPSVPCWRLPRVHRQLIEQGWYADKQHLLEPGFLRAFRYASGRHPYSARH